MRFDKLTTMFQQAIADAQSIAVGNDNSSVEPQHLLQALLQQEDGSTSSLLGHAGVNLLPLRAALQQSIKDLPKLENHAGEV
ncbi:MAG: Clp protease N-terminal domain-containing protein, partial [Methylophilaceae bacterium]|nr:Clp protease N-terminal domain-containing protein [Methylophilaceae bacterium]